MVPIKTTTILFMQVASLASATPGVAYARFARSLRWAWRYRYWVPRFSYSGHGSARFAHSCHMGMVVIVVHRRQAIHPRCCVGFKPALVGAQIWQQTDAVGVLSSCWSEWEDLKRWVPVAHSGIIEACTCCWHSRYAVRTAERKRRHDESHPWRTHRRTDTIHVNVLISNHWDKDTWL